MREAGRKVRTGAREMAREYSQAGSRVDALGGGRRATGSRYQRVRGAAGQAFGAPSIGGMVRGAVAFGGVYGAASELKKAKDFEETLVDLAVRGQKSRKWLTALRKSTIAASNEFGIGKEQIAAYAGVIIDQTGNTELAVSTLKDMTAVAYSANVPMEALAGTVVELQSKLSLQPKEFITAMGILSSQADVGKVPLSQMAQYLPEVLNAATAFGHKGVGALRDYGAVLQMAARGTGSLAEANTAMNRMLDQLVAKRSSIEKTLGIKLKKDGAWLQLAPMLKLISGKLADVQKKGGKLRLFRKGGKGKGRAVDVESFIIETFGIRGKKAMLPLLQQAGIGFGGRVGAKDGRGGLTSFDALIAAGGAGSIAKRVSLKRKLAPEMDAWNKSVEQFRNAIHEHLRPALVGLGKVMPGLAKYAMLLVDNWKLLLAAFVATKGLKFWSLLQNVGGGGGGGVAGALAGGGGGGGGGVGLSRYVPHIAIAAATFSVAKSVLNGNVVADASAVAKLMGLVDPKGRFEAPDVPGGDAGIKLLDKKEKEHRDKKLDEELAAFKAQVPKLDLSGPKTPKKYGKLGKFGVLPDTSRPGRGGSADPALVPSVGGKFDLPVSSPGLGTQRDMLGILQQIRDEIKKGQQLQIVDPNKTPAGTTDSRRGKK